MKKKIPTFEEYRAAVKATFWAFWPHLSAQEVEEYLNGSEAGPKIKAEYKGYQKYLKAETDGTLDDYTPSGNSPEAVGYCLQLMYE